LDQLCVTFSTYYIVCSVQSLCSVIIFAVFNLCVNVLPSFCVDYKNREGEVSSFQFYLEFSQFLCEFAVNLPSFCSFGTPANIPGGLSDHLSRGRGAGGRTGEFAQSFYT
jgi:hypothetical protein